MSPRGWARAFARIMLGLIFLMAGWHKVLVMGALEHARVYFTVPYADSWIPWTLLLATGVTIPFVELIAGVLLVLGWRVKEALLALGGVLLIVTYGHLLAEPLFSITGHILPRSALLFVVLLLPEEEDRAAVDAWLRRAPAGPPAED